MAQAILLQDVDKLGDAGEIVEVSPGYLRNFLVPRRLARGATAGSLAEAQRRIAQAEQEERDKVERAEENAALLRKTVLTIPRHASDDGKLFGAVTAQEITDAVRQARDIKLDKRKVHLNEPIKSTGTHMVTVEVADGVTAEIKTIVTQG